VAGNADFTLFQERVARHARVKPQSLALARGSSRLSYAELQLRSGALSARLVDEGVGVESIVAVTAGRSLDTVVAILAILQAGGAWVPLDPTYPAERLAYMLADSGARLLIGDAPTELPPGVKRLTVLDSEVDCTPPRDLPRPGPQNLAYVIYTSGSTGRPKGVMVTHGGLTHLAGAQAAVFGEGSDRRVFQFCSPSFDAYVADLVMALWPGGTLVLPAETHPPTGEALLRTLKDTRTTHVTIPPSVLVEMPDPMVDLKLETLICAGEALPASVVARWDGAGHFAKMIHNGIEYADMQLISESYDLLRQALGLSPAEIAEIFRDWNEGELQSYLIEITAEVLARTDPATGKALVDVIVDRAERQGGGRWTGQSALGLGVPATVIVEALIAHALARRPDQRASAGKVLKGPGMKAGDRSLIEDVRLALQASKIVAYAQGFDHINAASEEYGWGIDKGAMAVAWRAGCIIRSPFLEKIGAAYYERPDLPTLLVSPVFSEVVNNAQGAWRRVVATAVTIGVPAPGLTSALTYYDGLRRERLSAALIQGLRDYFAAGAYRRVDREGLFHTDWSGTRGEYAV